MRLQKKELNVACPTQDQADHAQRRVWYPAGAPTRSSPTAREKSFGPQLCERWGIHGVVVPCARSKLSRPHSNVEHSGRP